MRPIILAEPSSNRAAEWEAAIGVDIGGTNHTVALVQGTGRPLEILRGHTDRSGGPAALLRSLGALVPDLVRAAEEQRLTLRGIGVGFGGPVDVPSGMALLSHHVPGWENFFLRKELERLFGLPVTLDNDANAGALGEWMFGAGIGAQDMVYYNVGTGIGGALILDGCLRRGASSLAGELGHVTVDPDGPLCTCGERGCLESLASGLAIERMLSEQPIIHNGQQATAHDLFPLVAAGNPTALGIRDRLVEAFALALRNVLHTINPEVVVFGGGVSTGGDLLLDPLRACLGKIAFSRAVSCCRLVQAQLGYDAGVIGAASLAF